MVRPGLQRRLGRLAVGPDLILVQRRDFLLLQSHA